MCFVWVIYSNNTGGIRFRFSLIVVSILTIQVMQELFVVNNDRQEVWRMEMYNFNSLDQHITPNARLNQCWETFWEPTKSLKILPMFGFRLGQTRQYNFKTWLRGWYQYKGFDSDHSSYLSVKLQKVDINTEL